ncbi:MULTISPECIES: DUF2599 domain-containing protein [Gordonia]|uniref:DUF2599 domain-containing protein n=1 Tax=Gordonia TaxID=2053 RepID=UPI001E3A9479|nr:MULTISPECIES: DUF2599 domain-containing protein [Gordonia]MCM3895261.1 DUF2599 domain-containing protein [Gordonia sputi]
MRTFRTTRALVLPMVVLSFALLTGCGADSTSNAEPSGSTPSVSGSGAVASPSQSGPDAVSGAESGAPSASAVLDPAHPPPYVDHVAWASTAVGPSLQIYPTSDGRASIADDGAEVAWREVLALAPDADTPGMKAQFVCHWNFARAVDPNKPSWNLEPQRPVVDDSTMIATRCNPGGPEE